jgi:hypothetical protein
MADRWPLANGNWSNAANWNGGTLPDVGDDVFADGKTVTIDQDVTVLSVRTTQRSGGTAGGGFVFSTASTYTLFCDIYAGTTSCLTLVGSKTYNITGNVYGPINSGASAINLQTSQSNVTLNLTGNVTSGTGLTTARGIFFSGTGGTNNTINLIGNVENIGSGVGVAFANLNTSYYYQTGNIIGGASVAISLLGINTIITQIIGTAIGGLSSPAVTSMMNDLTSSNYIEKCLGSSTSVQPGAAVANLTQPLIIKEAQYSDIGTAPTGGYVKFVDQTNISVTVRKVTNVDKTLIDLDNAAYHLPAESDVRDGVLYDPDLASEGTLIVPDPSNVRNGVPTDNTVGTADLTAQDFFDAIASSSDPIAIRLRNVATVETTGDQISAFNV